MSEIGPQQFSAARVSIVEAAGPLLAGVEVSLVVDQAGISVYGGEPAVAWQVPYSAIRRPRLVVRRDVIEMTAWVAGALLRLAIPADALVGGRPEDLGQLLADRCGGDSGPPMRTNLTLRAKSGRFRWLIVLGVLALCVAGVGVAASLRAPSPESTKHASASDRTAAAALNLRSGDLPMTWGQDDPGTSPLAGLLGSSSGSKSTPAEKRASATIVSTYQQCMKLSNRADRVFGKAGVTPVVQVPSKPFGTLDGGGLIEVGTVTQRYESAQIVAADRAQAARPQFRGCFGQAMGRLVAAGTDLSLASAEPTVTLTPLGTPLGVFVTGAEVTLQIPSGGQIIPVEIGVSVLMADRTEQYLYTFASPGTFSPAQRQALIALQAARLIGAGNSKST